MNLNLTIQGISIVSFVPITLVKRKYSMNIFGTSMVIVVGVSQLLRQIIFWTKIMINYTTLNVLLVIVMYRTQMKKWYYHMWLIFTILGVCIKHFACTKILPRPFHTHVWGINLRNRFWMMPNQIVWSVEWITMNIIKVTWTYMSSTTVVKVWYLFNWS